MGTPPDGDTQPREVPPSALLEQVEPPGPVWTTTPLGPEEEDLLRAVCDDPRPDRLVCAGLEEADPLTSQSFKDLCGLSGCQTRT